MENSYKKALKLKLPISIATFFAQHKNIRKTQRLISLIKTLIKCQKELSARLSRAIGWSQGIIGASQPTKHSKPSSLSQPSLKNNLDKHWDDEGVPNTRFDCDDGFLTQGWSSQRVFFSPNYHERVPNHYKEIVRNLGGSVYLYHQCIDPMEFNAQLIKMNIKSIWED